MTGATDTRLAATADLIDSLNAEARLLQLRNLVVNNGGIWAVPDRPEDYAPVLFEVALFGVSASATEAGDLPRNWCRAARAVASGQGLAA